MEMNEIIIALSVILLVALIVFLVNKFGMKEKSFDDVLREQKLEQYTVVDKSKAPVKKEKKKKQAVPSKKKSTEKGSVTPSDNDKKFDFTVKEAEINLPGSFDTHIEQQKKVKEDKKTMSKEELTVKTAEKIPDESKLAKTGEKNAKNISTDKQQVRKKSENQSAPLVNAAAKQVSSVTTAVKGESLSVEGEKVKDAKSSRSELPGKKAGQSVKSKEVIQNSREDVVQSAVKIDNLQTASDTTGEWITKKKKVPTATLR